MSSGHSIFIPVANRAEEVQVQVDNLPAVTDVLDLLKAEEAPLHIWLDLAVRSDSRTYVCLSTNSIESGWGGDSANISSRERMMPFWRSSAKVPALVSTPVCLEFTPETLTCAL